MGRLLSEGQGATSILISGGSMMRRRRFLPPPPQRTQFFHFRIHFHQKVPASEVGAAPRPAGRRPQREILSL